MACWSACLLVDRPQLRREFLQLMCSSHILLSNNFPHVLMVALASLQLGCPLKLVDCWMHLLKRSIHKGIHTQNQKWFLGSHPSKLGWLILPGMFVELRSVQLPPWVKLGLILLCSFFKFIEINESKKLLNLPNLPYSSVSFLCIWDKVGLSMKLKIICLTRSAFNHLFSSFSSFRPTKLF